MLEFKSGPSREHDVAVVFDGRVVGRIRRITSYKTWQVDVEGDRPGDRALDDAGGVYRSLREAKAHVTRHFRPRS